MLGEYRKNGGFSQGALQFLSSEIKKKSFEEIEKKLVEVRKKW